MNGIKPLIALLFLVCSALACNGGGPIEGQVQGKRFRPAYDEATYYTQCTMSGNRTNCKPIYRQKHHNDAWFVTVCNDKDDCVEVSVSQQTYDETQIGQFYELSGR